ncbi:MAG: DUF1491 family protein [Alphaproteobacteria bacterium]|nr:DUF1491 family protein [Alphaproteobacteria bacterium]
MADEGRLPTGLWVDAVLTPLNARGIFYYITQKGNHASGLVMLKLNGLRGRVRLLAQQRDFMSNKLEWVSALDQEEVAEADADSYINRAIQSDPDLWVIEIEDPEMQNPFET